MPWTSASRLASAPALALQCELCMSSSCAIFSVKHAILALSHGSFVCYCWCPTKYADEVAFAAEPCFLRIFLGTGMYCNKLRRALDDKKTHGNVSFCSMWNPGSGASGCEYRCFRSFPTPPGCCAITNSSDVRLYKCRAICH